MNISKKQWMWIIVAVAIFLIYWFYFRNKKDGESGYKRNVGQGGNCFANKECSIGLVCRNGKCMPPVARTPRTSTATTMPVPTPAPTSGPRSSTPTYSLDASSMIAPAPTPIAVDTTTASLTPRSSTITNTLTGMSSIDGTTTL